MEPLTSLTLGWARLRDEEELEEKMACAQVEGTAKQDKRRCGVPLLERGSGTGRAHRLKEQPGLCAILSFDPNRVGKPRSCLPSLFLIAFWDPRYRRTVGGLPCGSPARAL